MSRADGGREAAVAVDVWSKVAATGAPARWAAGGVTTLHMAATRHVTARCELQVSRSRLLRRRRSRRRRRAAVRCRAAPSCGGAWRKPRAL